MTVVAASLAHPSFTPHADREWLSGLLMAFFVAAIFGAGVWAIVDARRRSAKEDAPVEQRGVLSLAEPAAAGERLVRAGLLSGHRDEAERSAHAAQAGRFPRPVPVLIALIGLGAATSALMEARNLAVVAWFVGNADSVLLEMLGFGFAVLLFMAAALVIPAPRWAAGLFAMAASVGIALAAAQWMPGRGVFERWEWVPAWIAAAFGLAYACWRTAGPSARRRVN